MGHEVGRIRAQLRGRTRMRSRERQGPALCEAWHITRTLCSLHGHETRLKSCSRYRTSRDTDHEDLRNRSVAFAAAVSSLGSLRRIRESLPRLPRRPELAASDNDKLTWRCLKYVSGLASWQTAGDYDRWRRLAPTGKLLPRPAGLTILSHLTLRSCNTSILQRSALAKRPRGMFNARLFIAGTARNPTFATCGQRKIARPQISFGTRFPPPLHVIGHREMHLMAPSSWWPGRRWRRWAARIILELEMGGRPGQPGRPID